MRPLSECPTYAWGSVPHWAHCFVLELVAVLVFGSWASQAELLLHRRAVLPGCPQAGGFELLRAMESWLPGTASPAWLMRVRRA